MPRVILLLCSGICLLNTADSFAQSSLKKPATIQQVVGYRLNEQKEWNVKQLPKNSVLYKFNSDHREYSSYSFSLSKQKPSFISLPNSTISFPLQQEESIYKQSIFQNFSGSNYSFFQKKKFGSKFYHQSMLKNPLSVFDRGTKK